METEWMTAEQASNYLQVQKRSLLLWVRNGRMPAYALAGTKRRIWRFRKEDLDTALFANRVLPSDSPTVLAAEGRQ
jgi:excisionase family DNA binding protein